MISSMLHAWLPTCLHSLPFNPTNVERKCSVVLELQRMVGRTASQHFLMLTADNCSSLLNVLQKSFEFAHQFNSEMQLRQALWTAGE